MKPSNILKHLFEQSEFESEETLASHAGVSKRTINRMFKGEGYERFDNVFDALTSDMDAEHFLLLLDLYKQIKSEIIRQEQFL